jgi:hypothetical protein
MLLLAYLFHLDYNYFGFVEKEKNIKLFIKQLYFYFLFPF